MLIELVLVFSAIVYVWERILQLRQVRHLQNPIPRELVDHVDEETYKKIRNYSIAKNKYSVVKETFSFVLDVVFVLAMGFARFWVLAETLGSKLPFQLGESEISLSIVYIILFEAFSFVTEIGFSIYFTFVLETKWEQNKTTVKTFVLDILKGWLLKAVLLLPLTVLFLKFFDWFPLRYVYIVIWVVAMVLAIALNTVLPNVILPLFFKFTALNDGSEERAELCTEIEEVARDAQIKMKGLYVVDGSRRSNKGNAMVVGMFGSKRVMLFDTLIEKIDTPGVKAVLGHEFGHSKHKDQWRMLGMAGIQLVAMLGVFSFCSRWDFLYTELGFVDRQPLLIGMLATSLLFSPANHVLGFLSNVVSRSCEFKADRFAAELGCDLVQPLIDLHKGNLMELDYDRWYSGYHMSHPTLLERIRALKKFQ